MEFLNIFFSMINNKDQPGFSNANFQRSTMIYTIQSNFAQAMF